MGNEVNEIVILRSRKDREPIDFERLKFLCYFVAGMTAEIMGFVTIITFLIRTT